MVLVAPLEVEYGANWVSYQTTEYHGMTYPKEKTPVSTAICCELPHLISFTATASPMGKTAIRVRCSAHSQYSHSLCMKAAVPCRWGSSFPN